MKKAIFTLICCSLISHPAAAVVSVIDSSNLAKAAEQVAAWSRQLAAMQEQLEQAKRQYTTITGNRGLGEILYNQDLYKLLPPEYQDIYKAAQSGRSDISGTLAEIAASERLKGSIDESQKAIEQRSQYTATVNKAVGLKGYQAAEDRLKQIEALMRKVNDTQDLKAINEIQGRIAIEQAAIQNEITKLQMIRQLQRAEQRLIKEQKHELSRRILNSNNSAMPRIK